MSRGGSAGIGRRQLLAWTGAFALTGCAIQAGEAEAEGNSALSAAEWTPLRSRLAGRLRLPADTGFDGARQTFNPLFDGRRPAAVASVASADDVKACVAFARAHAVPVAARS